MLLAYAKSCKRIVVPSDPGSTMIAMPMLYQCPFCKLLLSAHGCPAPRADCCALPRNLLNCGLSLFVLVARSANTVANFRMSGCPRSQALTLSSEVASIKSP